MPVNLVVDGGRRWLVSPYGDVGWVHNLRADPSVTLRRGRRTKALVAHEVGAEDAAPILKRYRKQVKITAPYFDAKAGDPVEAYAAEASAHPVFELQAASASTT